MSDTPASSPSSLFGTISGRKRKRATPKGCDGRPALNGEKAPTYLTDGDGNVKRLGRRDAEDIPNNTLVLRYHGEGRPDPSKLTDEQRKGLAPLPVGWEFVPVFAHVAGKRRGQILHEYGLEAIEHTGLDFNMALDAWMRASAQDPSVASGDHLLFMVLLHNTTTHAEATQVFPEDFDPRTMNPPSLGSVKALIAALDAYGLREQVSAQSFDVLSHVFAGALRDRSEEAELHIQATRNLHEFIEVAATLDALENRAVAQWLAEDFLLFDRDNLRPDDYSPGMPRLLEPTEVARRVELYEQWHHAVAANPELADLVTAFRETTMRGGRRGRVGDINDFIERYRSGDDDASRVLDAFNDVLQARSADVNFDEALRHANYMLRGWPLHELSTSEIATALTSLQIGSILSTHANQGTPVSLATVKKVFLAHEITQHCALQLRDVVKLSEETPFRTDSLEQLIVQAGLLAAKERSMNESGYAKTLLELTNEVAKELEDKDVPADTVALTAAVVFQNPPRSEGRRSDESVLDFEELRAQLAREVVAVHEGRKTLAQVSSDEPQGAPKLRYTIAVGSDIGAAPTYGVEWTRRAEPGRPLLGNIDPQHDGGSDTRAAIEAALDAPLPPRGVTLQTVRPDLDAFGAMAVLAARAADEDLAAPAVRERIAVIAAADRREDLNVTWAPKPYDPEFIQNPEIVGLSRTIRELEPHDAVVALGDWLRTGTLPASADRVIQERLASQRQMAERYAAQKASGEASVQGSAVPWVAAVDVAPDVVYAEAPVALLSKDTGAGFKHTIAVHPGFDWRVSRELVAALNAREAELGGTPEWGGPNNGKLLGSPQKGNSRITQAEFRGICASFLS